MDSFVQSLGDRVELMGAAILAALFISMIAYRMGFYNLPQATKESNLKLKHVCFAFLIFLVIQGIVGPLLAAIWLAIFPETSGFRIAIQGWMNVIVMALSAIGLFGYLQLLGPDLRSDIWSQGKKERFQQGIGHYFFGVMTWLIAYPLVLGVAQALALALYFLFGASEADQEAVRVMKKIYEFPALFVAMSLGIIFVIPIIEELLFRGFLQTFLKKHVGRFLGIIIAGMIFALFHYSPEQGLTNIEYISALFILSCFLGFIYERQGSLWAPIGLHTSFNAFQHDNAEFVIRITAVPGKKPKTQVISQLFYQHQFPWGIVSVSALIKFSG